MGYQVYEDKPARNHGVVRWAGYGVPAICDHNECNTAIDRGMAYRCEDHGHFEDPEVDPEEEWISVEGCNLHFCEAHRYVTENHSGVVPKPDTWEWDAHLLTDASWKEWRDGNPARVGIIVAALTPKEQER